jgi:hypothetical protein
MLKLGLNSLTSFICNLITYMFSDYFIAGTLIFIFILIIHTN